MSSFESNDFFTRSWSLYDLITEHNYMFHREIYAKIADLLGMRKDHNRYKLLDLGCGNARFLAPCLMQSPPAQYEGVDLSESALEEARGYLAGLSCPVLLKQGDLLEAVESTDMKWDVIFTGFAVHHLTPEEKARFFRAAGRCLPDSGWLLMADVVREKDQSREEYLEGYLRFMREFWNRIPQDELEAACAHVETCDYPEDLATLKEMAKASGLHASHVASQYERHFTILFSRKTLQQWGAIDQAAKSNKKSHKGFE